MINPDNGEEWDVAKKCDALEMELQSVINHYVAEFCDLDEELEALQIKPKENVPFVAIVGILEKIKLDYYIESKLEEEGFFQEDP